MFAAMRSSCALRNGSHTVEIVISGCHESAARAAALLRAVACARVGPVSGKQLIAREALAKRAGTAISPREQLDARVPTPGDWRSSALVAQQRRARQLGGRSERRHPPLQLVGTLALEETSPRGFGGRPARPGASGIESRAPQRVRGGGMAIVAQPDLVVRRPREAALARSRVGRRSAIRRRVDGEPRRANGA